jgi:UDP-glucose:(heptosyl)LPS alpha-1,3-glucosyltransferase
MNQRLAFCLYNYFPFGGLQRDMLRIAELCLARGYQIDIYTMTWVGDKPHGMQVFELGKKGWQNHTRILNFIKKLSPILTTTNYAAVIGFNKLPHLTHYFVADPCFAEQMATKKSCWCQYTKRGRIYLQLEAQVVTNQQITLFMLVPQQLTAFQRYYPNLTSNNIILPLGVNPIYKAPMNAQGMRLLRRKHYNFSEHTNLLLFIGSAFSTKGLDRVLLAISQLPKNLLDHTQLVVLGSGQITKFSKLAHKLDIADHVKFLGGCEDLAPWLQAADLLVHPAYNELAGHVLIEALVAGLPVLTTEICGYAQYIAQANAGIILPEPFAQTQFNQALIEILTYPQQRQTWRDNGIKYGNLQPAFQLHTAVVEKIIADTCYQG